MASQQELEIILRSKITDALSGFAQAEKALAGLRQAMQETKYKTEETHSPLSKLQGLLGGLDSVTGGATRGLSEFGEKMLGASEGAGALGVSSLAAGTGIGVLVAGTVAALEVFRALEEHLIEAGNSLANLTEKTGLSAEALDPWNDSASVFGINAEQMANKMEMLSLKVEEGTHRVRGGLQRLGISFEEFRGMNADERLRAIQEGFAGIADKGERATIAMMLWGKSGREMLPALSREAQGLRDILDGISGNEERAMETGRKLAEVNAVLAAVWERFKKELALAVYGDLPKAIEQFQDLTRFVKSTAEALADLITIGEKLNLDNLPDMAKGQGLKGPQGAAPAGPQGQAALDLLTEGTKADEEATRELISAQKELATARAGQLTGLDAELAKIRASTQAKIGDVEASKKSITDKQRLISIYQQLAAQEEANARLAQARKIAEEEAAAADKHRADFLSTSTRLEQDAAAAEAGLNQVRAASLGPLQAQIEKIDEAANAATVKATNDAAAALQSALAADLDTAAILAQRDAIIATIKTTQDEATAELLAADAKKQAETGARMVAEAEQQLAEHTAKGSGALRDRLAAIDAWLAKERERIDLLFLDGQITAEDADRLAALREADTAAQKQHEHWQHLQGVLQGIGSDIAAAQQAFQALGLAGDSALNQVLSAAQGTLQGLGDLASPNIFNKIKGGFEILGAVGGLIHSLFGGKSKEEKDAEELGRFLGDKVGTEFAKTVEKDAERLHISLDDASLLHLQELMDKTGKTAHEEAANIQKLMQEVASGAIPAKEGIQAIGQAWDDVRKEADQAGTVGDQLTIQMLKAAKASGEMTDNMKAFVAQEASLAAEGAKLIADGMASLDESVVQGTDWSTSGGNAASFFAYGFEQEMSSKGLIATLDDQKKGLDAFYAQLQQSGDAAGLALLQPFKDLEEQITGPTRASLQVFEGMDKVFQSMANQGDLTTSRFKAMEESLAGTQNALKEAGVSGSASMEALYGPLKDIVSASQQYGFQLDANTQALVDQAKAAGYAFPVDPMLRVAQAVEALVKGFGFDLPEAARRGGDAIADGIGKGGAAAAGQLGISMDKMHTTIDEFKDQNELAAQYVEQTWVGQLGEMPIHLEQMQPDWQTGFESLAATADPALELIHGQLGGILGQLNAIPGAAAAAGNGLGGMAGGASGSGTGGRGGGGGPHGGFAEEGWVPWTPGGRSIRVAEKSTERIVSDESLSAIVARSMAMLGAAGGRGGNINVRVLLDGRELRATVQRDIAAGFIQT